MASCCSGGQGRKWQWPTGTRYGSKFSSFSLYSIYLWA